jgi:hypothetical protein
MRHQQALGSSRAARRAPPAQSAPHGARAAGWSFSSRRLAGGAQPKRCASPGSGGAAKRHVLQHVAQRLPALLLLPYLGLAPAQLPVGRGT